MQKSRRAFLRRFAAAAVGVGVAGITGLARTFDGPLPAESPLGMRGIVVHSRMISKGRLPDGTEACTFEFQIEYPARYPVPGEKGHGGATIVFGHGDGSRLNIELAKPA